MTETRALADVLADLTGLRRAAPIASFATLFAGTAAGWRAGRDTVTIQLRDFLQNLDAPLQSSLYAGTGGLEGGADLAGKPKPLAFGRCFNVTPVFLGNLDLGIGALSTWQLHDGMVQAISAVRERGAEMAAVTGTPAIGEYRAYAAQGIFQLGFTPAGPITADVAGDASPTYVGDTAGIIRRILTGRLGYAATDLDATSFGQTTYDVPGEVQLYIGPEPVTALTAIDALIAGISGFFGGNRQGKFRLGQLKAPLTTPALILRPADIIDIQPIDLPATISPPNKRRRVAYGVNWSPSNDLAGAVAEADRKLLAQPFSVASAYSSAIATQYVTATEPPIVPGLFVAKADAQTEVDRLLALYGVYRRAFRVLTRAYLGQVEMGHTALVYHPDYQLAAGFYGVVTRWRETWGATPMLEIDLFG